MAGGLAACASGADIDAGSNTPTTNQPNETIDASVDETGSGDDAPTSSYGDAGTSGDEPTGVDDSGLDAGDEPPPAVGPTCTAGQTCVDVAPAGWTGYVQLVLQNGAAGTACAAPYAAPQAALTGQTNPDGGPATCGACKCVVPDSGLSCSIELLTGDLLCLGGASAPMTELAQNACVQISGFGTSANGGATEPALATGTCQPVGGAVKTAPPPPTSMLATVCGSGSDDGGSGGTAEGGAAPAQCTPTQACAPVPGLATGSPSGACIYQSGVQDCPTGVAFTAQYVVGAVDDNRGCGCFCGAPNCPADGYVNGYASKDCSGAVGVTIDAGAKCKAALSESSFMYHASRSGSLGSCDVDDAGPTGSVTIDGGTATTFCCIP